MLLRRRPSGADREDNNQVELDSKFNHNDLEAVELGQLHLYFKITSTMLAGYKFVDLVICYTIMRKKNHYPQKIDNEINKSHHLLNS